MPNNVAFGNWFRCCAKSHDAACIGVLRKAEFYAACVGMHRDMPRHNETWCSPHSLLLIVVLLLVCSSLPVLCILRILRMVRMRTLQSFERSLSQLQVFWQVAFPPCHSEAASRAHSKDHIKLQWDQRPSKRRRVQVDLPNTFLTSCTRCIAATYHHNCPLLQPGFEEGGACA